MEKFTQKELKELEKLLFNEERNSSRQLASKNSRKFEDFLEKFRFNENLPKSIIPQVENVLEGENTLKLKLINNKLNKESGNKQFIITPRGMLNSLKKSPNGEISIGRQRFNSFGEVVNDIILEKDLMVSRYHCKIYYKFGLFSKGHIPEDFFSFLMGTHSVFNYFLTKNSFFFFIL